MVEELRLTEFSGGIRGQVAASEAVDTQWLDMRGLVLDDERRLRAQWAAHAQAVPGGGPLSPAFGRGGDFIAGVRDDGLTLNASLVDALGRATGWEVVAIPAGLGTGHRPLTMIPVLNNEDEWVTGLLFNRSGPGSAPFALYRSGGVWAVKTWPTHYPTLAPTPNSMPRGAEVAATWGSYLVLGNILWMADDSLAFSTSNRRRYVNGLWFSQPGDYDSWDPIDVQFIGYRSSTLGQNQIVAMYPVEQGLLVLTTDRIELLRGTPNQHEAETLRVGISPQSPDHVTWWPEANAVCWVDGSGAVWACNGEAIDRLDQQIEAEANLRGAPVANVSVAAVGNYLLVTSPNSTWVLTSFGRDGAWTRLHNRMSHLYATGMSLYGRRLSAQWRFAVDGSGVRGTLDGAPLVSRLVTRTMPGGGHDTVFWHRHGVRAVGAGTLRQLEYYPDARPVGQSYTVVVNAPLAERRDHVVPCHGPSLDSCFAYEFEGDVTVEGVSLWAHEGRARR